MPSAYADYMREYRQQNPELYKQNLKASRAFRRALTALKHRHLEEFSEILTEERAAVGLPPVGVRRPGRTRKDDAA